MRNRILTDSVLERAIKRDLFTYLPDIKMQFFMINYKKEVTVEGNNSIEILREFLIGNTSPKSLSASANSKTLILSRRMTLIIRRSVEQWWVRLSLVSL